MIASFCSIYTNESKSRGLFIIILEGFLSYEALMPPDFEWAMSH